MKPCPRPNDIAWKEFSHRHFELILLGVLAFVVGVLYLPALDAYFISDDFSYVSQLFVNIKALLNMQQWEFWFLQSIDGYVYFRPFGHVLMLLDFVTWNLNPLGYHFTNVLLHVLSSFEVFLLSGLLLRNRTGASIASILFAVLPVHAGAVSWIAARYDVIAGLFYFASLIFFVIYLRNSQWKFLLISLSTFVFGLASKETMITLPLLVLLYDGLFNFRQFIKIGGSLKRHLPYWIILLGYLTVRVAGLHSFGYAGAQFIPEGLWYWVDLNLFYLVAPLFSDMTAEIRWILIGSAVLLVTLSRARREVVFCLLWIPITLIPTMSSGPSDRSFYIPSFGLALVLASVFSWLVSHPSVPLRALGLLALLLTVSGYSVALFSRNQSYNAAGQIAEAIPQRLKALHPTLPSGARLVFIGVPDQTPDGTLVYLTGLGSAIALTYPDSKLEVYKFTKFPIWFDNLERTFFIQVEHRHVADRADLLRALEERKRCESFSAPALTWDFSTDEQGWEPWNDLTHFENRNGMLTTKSLGKDPYMASPPIEIPAIAIGEVEITMRVRANESTLQGSIYWLADGQSDFSPALQVPFSVYTDGELHSYQTDIGKSGMLLIGDRVTQLRLDPVDAPAEIAIKSIRVNVHCTNSKDGQCECGR